MEKNSTEFMQQVYDLATGAYNPGSSIVAENAFVENVFSEGSVCAEAYREVYAAGERLCDVWACSSATMWTWRPLWTTCGDPEGDRP